MTMETQPVVRIGIVGVGGAGNNAINRMIDEAFPMVHTVAINTDSSSIQKSKAQTSLQIGQQTTGGRGTGSDPEKGRRAAEESCYQIEQAIKDCDMLFITAGMGGGVGTGAAPVVAEIAREHGILTVGVVTKPFVFEGQKRIAQAEDGIRQLERIADALVVIPNDNLKHVSAEPIGFGNAFAIADQVLVDTVRNLAEVIWQNLEINCDFADISYILQHSGRMHTATGRAAGTRRAESCVKQVISNSLLGTSVANATGVLLCITASDEVGFDEVEQITSAIKEKAHPDANIIFGLHFDNDMDDVMKVTMMAAFGTAE